MMKLLRLLAQLVDVFVGIAIFVAVFLWLPGLLLPLMESAIAAVLTLVTAVALVFLVQLPFLFQNQTVGKAFFGLEIATTDPARPLTLSILLQREIFCKLMSCFFICIPALFGKSGGHEAATGTQVIRRKRKGAPA